jgi:hypothetical protein
MNICKLWPKMFYNIGPWSSALQPEQLLDSSKT